jgi:hypothetical protein
MQATTWNLEYFHSETYGDKLGYKQTIAHVYTMFFFVCVITILKYVIKLSSSIKLYLFIKFAIYIPRNFIICVYLTV